MPRTLGELAQLLKARLHGDPATQISSVASIASARSGDLVFVEDPRHFPSALSSAGSAIVVGEHVAPNLFPHNTTFTKPLMISPHPRLAFARAAAWLAQSDQPAPSIHPTAIIDPTAQLDPSVTVEERAVIRPNVHIAVGTIIGAGSILGPGVSIGRDCRIYPNVTIYPGTTLGDRVIVHAGAVLGSDGFGYVRDPATGHYEKFPQIGRLVLEDDVEIGANSTLDRGALDETRIRRGTKIDNLVHVGHNVQIGEDVVIAAQTGLSGSSTVENNVIIGGQVGIADHVRIEEGVILGAQSGIPSKKVIRGKGIVFWGTPARPIKHYLKDLAILARLSKEK
jgi:UDP-3-O-[3-hydroxymyristoyl] glucosamine N-acyltransferase